MIHLAELHILRYVIQKKKLNVNALKDLLANSLEQTASIKELVLQNQLISPSNWNSALTTLQMDENWVETPSRLKLDNHKITSHLAPLRKIRVHTTRKDIREALDLSEASITPEYAPRVHEILIGKGIVTAGDVEKYVGIEKNRILECLKCQVSFKIHQYFPWKEYPCPCCEKNLTKTPYSGFFTRHNPEDTLQVKAVLAEPSESPELQKFGRYTILEQIGEGELGKIYKSYDPLLKQTIALKVIPKDKIDLTLRNQFYQEINLKDQLSHPNILTIYEMGEEEGQFFFTMRYVEGVSLRAYVEKEGMLEPAIALTIMEKICKAVFYAHEHSVVHKNINPENILINAENEPYLMEFGVAKKMHKSGTRYTKTGAIIESPEFMSPEAALGKRKLTYSADIYALGGIFYFMVTGISPFQAEKVLQLLHKIIHEPSKSPRALNPSVRRDVATVILKCLEKKEEDRYSHSSILLYEIQAILQGNPIIGNSFEISRILKNIWKNNKVAFGSAVIALVFVFLSVSLWIVTLQEKITTNQSLSNLQKKEKFIRKHLALMHKKNGTYNLQLKELQKTLRLNNKIKGIVLNPYIQNKEQQLKKILQILEKALPSNEKKAILYRDISKVYFQMKKWKKSYQYYKKAVKGKEISKSDKKFLTLLQEILKK